MQNDIKEMIKDIETRVKQQEESLQAGFEEKSDYLMEQIKQNQRTYNTLKDFKYQMIEKTMLKG